MNKANTISIEGIPKSALLAALYNGSKAQGIGRLIRPSSEMTAEMASEIIREQGLRFDYLAGTVLKVDLSGDELWTALYNRDVGEGAAEAIVEKLRGDHGQR